MKNFSLEKCLATFFGLGLLPKAPGTWGSLGALPLGVALIYTGGAPALLLGTAAVTVIGWWAAKKYGEQTGEHDSPKIVIDEVAGQFLALIPAGLNPILIILSFILFRLFDVTKPWPVSWADQKLENAAGVMLDDLIAGLYAALCLIGLHYAGLG